MSETGWTSAPATRSEGPVLSVENFAAGFNGKTIIENVTFSVERSEIVAICGGSGSGKSTLLKHIIGLYRPQAGKILIEGRDLFSARGDERRAILRGMGVMYQAGALFGSMSLRENVRLPLEEFTDLPSGAMDAIALSKLRLVGLGAAAEKLPSEISGGMQKRAAIARAMALDPPLMLLDEPSAGLDPITSAELDELLLGLRSLMGTTFVVVTHELASIFTIADRCVVLDGARKTMVALDAPAKLRDHSKDEWVRAFFNRGDAEGRQQSAEDARGARPSSKPRSGS